MAIKRKREASPFCTLQSALCNLRVRSFTLIEMLTVIAIIGILAAILIPTVQVAMRKARIAVASSDVSRLTQAATAYNLEFGAFPPDDSTGLVATGVNFPSTLNPNECLTWFLTRTYSSSSSAAGIPWAAPVAWSYPYGSGNGWDPTASATVFSRGINAGPFFDVKAKQRTDYNANGFSEFVDPWGRPYMYRASVPQLMASVNGGVITILPSSDGRYSSTPWPMPAGWTAAGLKNVLGQITLSDSVSQNNGTFSFSGTGDNTLTVTGSIANSNTLQVSFPLHNPQSCDIYSLGPYGVTRAANMPYPDGSKPLPNGREWKPVHGGNPMDNSSLDMWFQVWGTPGDGNDINSTNGNVIIDSKYQDNICNW